LMKRAEVEPLPAQGPGATLIGDPPGPVSFYYESLRIATD
jgi:hypothetical protein